MSYEGIVEVVKAYRKAGANYYLDNGYRLLAVEQQSELREKTGAKAQDGGSLYYVQRSIVFVLGRPQNVTPVRPYEQLPVPNGKPRPLGARA